MIATLNQSEIFGAKSFMLSKELDAYLGAFAYCLECGRISGNPCWAESRGAKEAVTDTVLFIKAKFGNRGLANFRNMLQLLGFLTIEKSSYYQFSTTAVIDMQWASSSISEIYYENPEFKEFVDEIRSIRKKCGENFNNRCITTIENIFYENRDMRFFESFKTIIERFVAERDKMFDKSSRISHVLLARIK